MLEIESGIGEWRQRMAEQLGQDRNLLDEMENHLREEIERLTASGKTPAEALTLAMAKFGTPEAVAKQFANVSTPWLPVYFVVGGATLAIIALLLMIGFSNADPLLRVHVGTITAGYVLTYSIGVLAMCWAIRTLFGELPIGKRAMTVRALGWMSLVALGFTLVGTVTGGFWSNQHLGRFWGWDLKETGALVAICWLVVMLVLLNQAPFGQRWLMSWGMLGKITIIMAWFVAGTLAANVKGYPVTPAELLALAGLTTHFAFYFLLVGGLIAVKMLGARRLELS